MAESPEPGWTTNATITRVIDGDTVIVQVKRTLRIRPIDCWAPAGVETKFPAEKELGIAATAMLEKLLPYGSRVRVQIPAGDDPEDDGQEGDGQEMADVLTFGRFLGHVFLPDGRNVADVLIEAGHAYRTKKELQAALKGER